jgi:hypothetical protein
VSLSSRARASGLTGDWQAHEITGEMTITEDRFSCVDLEVDAPDCCDDAEIDIYSQGNSLKGQTLCVPTGVSLSRRARASGKTGDWLSEPINAENVTLTEDRFCCMEIEVPSGVQDTAEVNIYGVGRFEHGEEVCLPTSIDIYWRLEVGGEVSCWSPKHVDCTPLEATCEVHIKLPAGVYIYIENVGWFENCDWIEVVPTRSFRYKLYDATQKVSTGWKTKTLTAADCCNDWDLTGEYCDMHVDLDGSDGYVYIENVGWFQHSTHLWMPMGATFRYKAYDSTQKVSTGWITHEVDCNDLYPGFCNMHIDLGDGTNPDPDGWVYIENVGWFQHCDYKWMPMGASFRYKAYDKTQKVSTDWKTHGVDCDPLKPEI